MLGILLGTLCRVKGLAMPKQKRFKTKYPGVYFIEGSGADGKMERIYYIQYRRDGKLIEEKAGRQFENDMTPSRASAKRADRLQGRELPNNERREQAREEKWTFSKLWEEYKRSHPLKGLAQDESRFRTYLEPSFGAKDPKDLIPLDIDRMKRRELKDKAPQTVKNVLALLRRIARFGERKQLCSGLSFQIEMPENINNITTEDLNNDQVRHLLEALDADPDVQATGLIKLCLCTGLRRGELLRLQWAHIDFDRGFIHIKDPKGGPDQVIPLNNSARQILENHPRSDSPYVFPGRDGKQKVDPRKALNRIKKAAGLPADFRPLHGLRHTFASSLASSGQVDLYTLQRLLTHKSPQMTQRYAHLRDDALRDASELAGDLVKRTAQPKKQELELKDPS
jgi:integrase